MKVQDCSTGQQVIHKESGKLATIRRLPGSSGEVELSFENGTTSRVHVRLIEPATHPDAEATDRASLRACPQCAAKMPVAATVCPACGFTHGVKSTAAPRNLAKFLLLVVLLAAAAYAAWKFAFAGKGP